MREEHEVRLPQPGNQPGKGLLSTGARRIAGGLACSMAVTAIWNVAPIKKAVLYACSAVVHIGGDPISGEGGIDAKIDKTLGKLEDIAKQNKQPALPIHLPVNPVTKAVNETKQAVTDTVDDVKDKIKDVGGMISPATQKAMEALRERKEKQDAAEKERLLIEAPELGIECDETWTLERLRAAVNRVKAASAQAKREAFMEWWGKVGPNGYCPGCRKSLRVSSAGHGRIKCPNPRCGYATTADKARAMGTPPMPRQYPIEFLRWWNKQG